MNRKQRLFTLVAAYTLALVVFAWWITTLEHRAVLVKGSAHPFVPVPDAGDDTSLDRLDVLLRFCLGVCVASVLLWALIHFTVVRLPLLIVLLWPFALIFLSYLVLSIFESIMENWSSSYLYYAFAGIHLFCAYILLYYTMRRHLVDRQNEGPLEL